MDETDIILNFTLRLGSAVWDSNGTVHWAVGERAVLNDRGTMMTWAACATPQPVLPPHNPGYLEPPWIRLWLCPAKRERLSRSPTAPSAWPCTRCRWFRTGCDGHHGTERQE